MKPVGLVFTLIDDEDVVERFYKELQQQVRVLAATPTLAALSTCDVASVVSATMLADMKLNKQERFTSADQEDFIEKARALRGAAFMYAFEFFKEKDNAGKEEAEQ